MSWRTMRAAIAAMRCSFRGRGGVIVIHRPDCALHDGPVCSCHPRMQVVRAR